MNENNFLLGIVWGGIIFLFVAGATGFLSGGYDACLEKYDMKTCQEILR